MKIITTTHIFEGVNCDGVIIKIVRRVDRIPAKNPSKVFFPLILVLPIFEPIIEAAASPMHNTTKFKIVETYQLPLHEYMHTTR